MPLRRHHTTIAAVAISGLLLGGLLTGCTHAHAHAGRTTHSAQPTWPAETAPSAHGATRAPDAPDAGADAGSEFGKNGLTWSNGALLAGRQDPLSWPVFNQPVADLAAGGWEAQQDFDSVRDGHWIYDNKALGCEIQVIQGRGEPLGDDDHSASEFLAHRQFGRDAQLGDSSLPLGMADSQLQAAMIKVEGKVEDLRALGYVRVFAALKGMSLMLVAVCTNGSRLPAASAVLKGFSVAVAG